jgi:hypothetical protein
MEEFLAQYGLLILFALAVLWLLTKGRRHLETVKSEAKDAALKAVLKEAGFEKLKQAEKLAKMAKIAKTIKAMNPKKAAGKAIDVLAEEIAAIPERDLPAPVDEEDDIDGLGAALNKAIKAEEKREKVKRGLKKAGSIGLKILKGVIS